MSQSPMDRRRFTQRLITATGAALVVGEGVMAQADENGKDPAKPAAEKETPVEGTPPEVKLEDHLVEMVALTYPQNLNESNLQQIRHQFAIQMARSQVLSSFPLSNGDEPAPTFQAFRGSD